MHSSALSGSHCSLHLAQLTLSNFWPWYGSRDSTRKESWFCTDILSAPLPQTKLYPRIAQHYLNLPQDSPVVNMNLEVQDFPCNKRNPFHSSLPLSLTCKEGMARPLPYYRLCHSYLANLSSSRWSEMPTRWCCCQGNQFPDNLVLIRRKLILLDAFVWMEKHLHLMIPRY